jgi:hypothetical protein
MPSILTHQYFANQLIDTYQHQWPFLKTHHALVWVGSQGPDPFFFFGRAPFKKRLGKETINQFGSTLHNQLPTKSILPLLSLGWFSATDQPILKAYVFGALTHYILDSICHPYIFYRSGFDEQGQLTGLFNADHARLEVAIDLALIAKYRLSETMYQPKQTLCADGLSLSQVSELYHRAFPQKLDMSTFRQAVDDMKATYRFLYHGSFLNRLLVILLAGKRSLPFSLMHPTKIAEPLVKQVLNLNRKKWYHPVTNQPSTFSFAQMLEAATVKFSQVATLLNRSTLNPNDWETLTQRIDYDGKPFGTTMQHQSPFPYPLSFSKK